MTIAAVNGRTVQFTAPLKFAHYGGKEYQAEVIIILFCSCENKMTVTKYIAIKVGLLSRRIEFRGNDADSTANQFGGNKCVVLVLVYKIYCVCVCCLKK